MSEKVEKKEIDDFAGRLDATLSKMQQYLTQVLYHLVGLQNLFSAARKSNLERWIEDQEERIQTLEDHIKPKEEDKNNEVS